ncbi:hypothetical protein XYCOK13_24560 [Xylanibacillus composti]|uniref:VOC domain-containing protein n=1 Tax=Xylanibacillus composti TaxID=1572762 RepID=A0A8J4H2A1_9BACL|nr:VOC family protein [Xylanibacillus composti]GIQ69632.1 hypothetical protein XYCOK13_24560 [Xylanibacillus composti]
MQIAEITLLVNQLEPVTRFYHEILKFPVIECTGTTVRLQCGSSVLSFQQEDKISSPYYHFAFNIAENKLDLAMDYLRQKGISLNRTNESEVFYSESWDSHSIYFYDPAGNIVEFIARHRLPSKPGTTFSTDDILNISEIGLPTSQVEALSDLLVHQLDECVYISGDAVFTPIGDEEGLLILTTLERQWLGSNKKVEIFPLKVQIDGKMVELRNFLNLPYCLTTA